MAKLGIIIQARLGATRFPSKIQMKLTNTLNLLDYMIKNLLRVGAPIVVAMPSTDAHKEFSKTLTTKKQIDFFFGDENNVLGRFVDCANYYAFPSIVRICGDNPLINIDFLNNLINSWSDHYDYSSYYTSTNVPAMKTHYGLFGEIIRTEALKKIQNATIDNYYLEHVTPYIYENSKSFVINKLNMPEPFFSGVPLRLTVDTKIDYENIKTIINNSIDSQDPIAILNFCQEKGLIESMSKAINRNKK